MIEVPLLSYADRIIEIIVLGHITPHLLQGEQQSTRTCGHPDPVCILPVVSSQEYTDSACLFL